MIARVLPIELQHLHPLSFHRHHFSLSHTHTHTLSLSLSLSLTHTHTHTHIQGCQLIRFRCSMLWSVLACYTRAKNATVTYRKIDLILFSRPETQYPLFPASTLSLTLSKQRSAAKSEPNLLRCIASFYEDAVMCSLSIASRQTCARGRGHHHFEL